jgi:hypothetical protein
MSEALDFARYAPVPVEPRLVWENAEPHTPDDMATAWTAIGTSLRILALAVRVIAAITAGRIRARIDRVMHSLTIAWAVAGSGWGLGLGLAFIMLVR